MSVEFVDAVVIGAGMAVGQILVEFVRALARLVNQCRPEFPGLARKQVRVYPYKLGDWWYCHIKTLPELNVDYTWSTKRACFSSCSKVLLGMVFSLVDKFFLIGGA